MNTPTIELLPGKFQTVREYNGQRVVTFKDIDMAHERPDGTASRNFRANRQHFVEGVDYFKLQRDENRRVSVTSPNGVIVTTESGYLMLVKSFNDDIAWTVQRALVNAYFRMKDMADKQEDTEQITPGQELTPVDYLNAARSIAMCRRDQMPYVVNLLREAGFDIDVLGRTARAEKSGKYPALYSPEEREECAKETRAALDVLKQMGLTYADMGRVTGMNRSLMHRYYNMTGRPSPTRAQEIIDAVRRYTNN